MSHFVAHPGAHSLRRIFQAKRFSDDFRCVVVDFFCENTVSWCRWMLLPGIVFRALDNVTSWSANCIIQTQRCLWFEISDGSEISVHVCTCRGSHKPEDPSADVGSSADDAVSITEAQRLPEGPWVKSRLCYTLLHKCFFFYVILTIGFGLLVCIYCSYGAKTLLSGKRVATPQNCCYKATQLR